MKKTLGLTFAVLAAGLVLPASAEQARVISFSGAVLRAPAGSDQMVPITSKDLLSEGDVIHTGDDGRLILELDRGHKLQVEPNTKAQLYTLKAQETQAHVSQGAVRSWVKKLKAQEKFSIKTPTATCAVRGTDFFVIVGELTRVEVYEGLVAAREEMTGQEVMVNPGEFTEIRPQEAPKPPEQLEKKDDQGTKSPEETKKEQLAKAYQEIFHEISREAVMERAAEEIKLAELQNGKALIDAFGHRVRLEEYVYREQPDQFKYVVLNTRDDRFDWGQITFFFNKDLPEDLSLATKFMFKKDGATAPEWYPERILTVMSNTVDRINEDAYNGRPVADDAQDPSYWTTFFANQSFSINGVTKWSFADDGDGIPQTSEFTYAGGGVSSDFSLPSGPDSFHFRSRDDYDDGTFVQADDYIINDDGKIFDLNDVNPTLVSGTQIRNTILGLNFERSITSTEMQGRKIDLVFSVKLLADAGILDLPTSLSSSSSLVASGQRRD